MLFTPKIVIDKEEMGFIDKFFNIVVNVDNKYISCYSLIAKLHYFYSKYKNRLILDKTNGYFSLFRIGSKLCESLVPPFNLNGSFICANDLQNILTKMKSFGEFDSNYIIIPLILLDDTIVNSEMLSKYRLSLLYDEFIYDKASVINMQGHNWKRKRNIISRFKRDNPDANVRQASINDLNSIMKVREIWKKEKSKTHIVFDDNWFKIELEFLLSDFGSRFGKIFVCEINKNIIGFCSVSHFCKDTLYTGHNNYIRGYVGINEYLYRESLLQCDYSEKYVNDGEVPLNNHSIYSVKMHYNPVQVNHIYGLRFKR